MKILRVKYLTKVFFASPEITVSLAVRMVKIEDTGV